MRWLDVEPYVAQKLRREWGVLAANVLLINEDIDARQLARRYMKMPSDVSVLDLQQAYPYFLFHLSKKSPTAYKTAFELLFRDALFQVPREEALRGISQFGYFMQRNKMPVPVWFWRLVLKENGRQGACAYIGLMPEKDLFRLAALYRSHVPDPTQITYEPLRVSVQQEHDEAYALFNAALTTRTDAWSGIYPPMFWTMVGDVLPEDASW